jgi:protocatechuate 3,4-dioxygenase beta subunit
MKILNRRQFTVGTVKGLAAGAAGMWIASCDPDGGAGAIDAAVAPDGTLPFPDGGGACTLYPQSTEGPYYLDDDLVRRDVTEGRPGAATTVLIRVVSAGDCAPLANAAVDIWQCDADGVYSGYPGQLGGLDTTGQTFLRGTQLTDADGVAQFETIFPGWYPGRTTHIHFKVHLTATTEVTSQLYFEESVNSAVYATGAYVAHGQKDTPNTSDGPFNALGANPPLASVTGDAASGLVASLTITVG